MANTDLGLDVDNFILRSPVPVCNPSIPMPRPFSYWLFFIAQSQFIEFARPDNEVVEDIRRLVAAGHAIRIVSARPEGMTVQTSNQLRGVGIPFVSLRCVDPFKGWKKRKVRALLEDKTWVYFGDEYDGGRICQLYKDYGIDLYPKEALHAMARGEWHP